MMGCCFLEVWVPSTAQFLNLNPTTREARNPKTLKALNPKPTRCLLQMDSRESLPTGLPAASVKVKT